MSKAANRRKRAAHRYLARKGWGGDWNRITPMAVFYWQHGWPRRGADVFAFCLREQAEALRGPDTRVPTSPVRPSPARRWVHDGGLHGGPSVDR